MPKVDAEVTDKKLSLGKTIHIDYEREGLEWREMPNGSICARPIGMWENPPADLEQRVSFRSEGPVYIQRPKSDWEKIEKETNFNNPYGWS